MPQNLEHLKAAGFKKNAHSAHSKYFDFFFFKQLFKYFTDGHKKVRLIPSEKQKANPSFSSKDTQLH